MGVIEQGDFGQCDTASEPRRPTYATTERLRIATTAPGSAEGDVKQS